VFNTVKPEPVSFTLVLENNPTLLTKIGKKNPSSSASHMSPPKSQIQSQKTQQNQTPKLVSSLFLPHQLPIPLIYHNYMTQKLRKCQHFCTKDLSTAHSQIPTHYHHGNLPPPKDKYPSSAAQA
jgi:hypothetical protein